MKFNGKTFLIIGASGGIGEQIAYQMHQAGAKLILHSHKEIKNKNIINLDNVVTLIADITHSDGIQTIINHLKVNKITLSGVIFAAGMNLFKWLPFQDDLMIQKLINLNLQAPILLTKYLLPLLDLSEKSSLVYIGSTMGTIGLPGFSTYCASKFGLRGFVQSLRRELCHKNIDCLYIAPRGTKTRMNSQAVLDLNKTLNYKMDDPQWVAQKVLNSIKTGSRETYLGFPEKIFTRLNSVLPNLVDKFIFKKTDIFKKYSNL